MLLEFDNIELFLNFISLNSVDPTVGVFNQYIQVSTTHNTTESEILTIAYAKLAEDTLIAIQRNNHSENTDYYKHLLDKAEFTQLNFKFNMINDNQINFNILSER